ncbi:MAG TPA: NTPase [Candidatus Methanomethylophilaceae archaeon]|nr:NTPase [Candidatus Methanomethylophilaceae archaeon]
MARNIKIGITGLPGAGKTYVLQKVIEMLEENGLTIGGMINDAIGDGRHKTGSSVRDLVTGQSEVFASVDIESRIKHGKLGVDIEALERVGVGAIRRASEECDVIVIDEVGKMEVESPAFIKAVKDSLEVGKPMIITIHKKSRNPLLQDIRRRDDIRILEVTPTNRNLLPYKIIRLIDGEQD